MQPIQSYNGYDHPWVGGTGTNQLDYDNATLTHATVSGTADDFTLTVTGNSVANINFPLPDSFAGQTLYLSGTITRTGTSVTNIAAQLMHTEGGVESADRLGSYTDGTATLSDIEVAIPAGATNIRIRVVAAGTNDTLTDPPITVNAQNLRLCAEQGQSWSPYANICPIYGHTAATATRCARNFLENKCETYTFAVGVTVTVGNDGTFTFNGTLASAAVLYYNIQTNAKNTSTQRDNVKHLPNGNYIASVIGDAGARLQVMVYNPGDTLNALAYANGGQSTPFTIDNAYRYNFCRLYLAAGTYTDATAKLMIRSATDTVITYAPYQGNSYTVSFGQTVYGGTLDFVTGVLTATWGYIASYNGETLPAEWISDRDVYAEGATPTTGAAVAYKLATPQTIQVTPQEITTLLGTNNIWATTETNEP